MGGALSVFSQVAFLLPVGQWGMAMPLEV